MKLLQKSLATNNFPHQTLLFKILLIFWAAAKIISYKAWIVNRSFPVIAPFNFLENIPGYIHVILFGMFFLFAVILFFKPQLKVFLILILISETISCIFDVVRWQPWQYQYIFMLLAYIIFKNNTKSFFTVIIIMLASTYIFSGLHKLNGGFLFSIWEKMILKKFFDINTEKSVYIHYSGLLLPVIEIISGILLFSKYKKKAAYILMGMHLFILVILGPYGLNHNIVVWPWNVAMIFFLYIIFCNTNYAFTFNDYYQAYFSKVVIIFWLLLPALSFINLWDNYLSSSLYSGSLNNIAICLPESNSKNKLIYYLSKNKSTKFCKGQKMLSLQNWAIKEMNVPPYPEEWYYRKLAVKFKQLYPETGATFTMYAYPYKSNQKIE